MEDWDGQLFAHSWTVTPSPQTFLKHIHDLLAACKSSLSARMMSCLLICLLLIFSLHYHRLEVRGTSQRVAQITGLWQEGSLEGTVVGLLASVSSCVP